MPSLLYFYLKILYNNVHIILIIGCLSNVFVVVFLESNCVNSDWEYYSSNQRMPSKYPLWMGHLCTVHPPYRLFHEKHVSLSYHLKLIIVKYNGRFNCAIAWIHYRCICNPNLACLKTDDDLSVNAYVYRCKTRPVTTTEIIPTTIWDLSQGYTLSNEAAANSTPLALLRYHCRLSKFYSSIPIPNLFMFPKYIIHIIFSN